MSLFDRDDSVLIIVDYQPAMMKGVHNDEIRSKLANIMAVAKAAAILKVPVVLTSIDERINGKFVTEITDLFPKVKVLERKVPSFNAAEDEAVMTAILKTGRNKIIITGLWTSMCMAFTALDLLHDHEVFGLMDSCGDASKIAHKYGVKRMIQAGVVPITWMPVVSAWMHDWQDPAVPKINAQIFDVM